MWPTVIAGVVAALISGAVGLLTARSSNRSAERIVNAQAEAAERAKVTESRAEIEEQAFSKAKEYYTDRIDRQDEELGSVHQEVNDLREKLRDALRQLEECQRQNREQGQKIEELRGLGKRLARAVTVQGGTLTPADQEAVLGFLEG